MNWIKFSLFFSRRSRNQRRLKVGNAIATVPCHREIELLESRALLSRSAIAVLAGDATGDASAAEISGSHSIAVDDAGNVLILNGSLQRVLKISPDQEISTIAGGGSWSFVGGNQDSRDLDFYGSPRGLAAERDGTFYFSTRLQFRETSAIESVVVKVNPDHTIEVVAGGGTDTDWSGSEMATDLKLNYVRTVAIAQSGSLYFNDMGRVVKVNIDGGYEIIAGGGEDEEWDGSENATDLKLTTVQAIAVDSLGAVFFRDGGQGRILKIESDGGIEFIVGGGDDTEWDGSERAEDLSLDTYGKIALDETGNLYFAGRDRVVQVNSDGTIKLIAGGGTGTNWQTGDRALDIQLSSPQGITVDSSGHIYVAQFHPSGVIRIKPDQTIEVIAGGTGDVEWDGSEASNELRLGSVRDIEVDQHGNVYFSDGGRDRVVRLGPHGTVDIIAGGGRASAFSSNRLATEMRFNYLDGIAVDSRGIVYFYDWRLGLNSGPVIVKVDLDGVASVFAGGGTNTSWNDGDYATDLRLGRVSDVEVDTNGNVYFLDHERGYIVEIESNGKVKLRAGSGNDPDKDGIETPEDLRIDRPSWLSIDAENSIYFSHDSFPSTTRIRILKVDTDDNVEVFAGGGGSPVGFFHVSPTALRLSAAFPPVFTSDGRIYFGANGQLVELQPDGLVGVVAGGGNKLTVRQGDHSLNLIYTGHFSSGLSFTSPVAAGPAGPVFTALGRILTINSAPIISTRSTVRMTEHATEVTTIRATDKDTPAQTLTYTVSGGDDASLFHMNRLSGQLSFHSPPNFDSPTDVDLNNTYHVQVTVTDVGGLSDVQDLEISVKDNRAPVISSHGRDPVANVRVFEGNREVTVVTAVDPNIPAQSLMYSVSGGADQALVSIDPESGVLAFNTTPDYENAVDENNDNVYEVEVSVTDGELTDTQRILISVQQLPPARPASVNWTADGDSGQPVFSWPDVERAANYEVWMGRAFPTSSRVYANESFSESSSWTPPAELQPGFYRVWVRGRNEQGSYGPWSAAAVIDVKPTLRNPELATFETRPTLEWDAIPYTSGYEFYLRTSDRSLDDLVVTDLPASATSYTPTFDLPSGTTRWWIRSRDAQLNRGWSKAGNVYIQSTVIVEADGAAISWLPAEGAGRYLLHVEDMDGLVVIRENRLLETSFITAELQPGTYRAWVKAISGATDGFASGLWSRVTVFTKHRKLP